MQPDITIPENIEDNTVELKSQLTIPIMPGTSGFDNEELFDQVKKCVVGISMSDSVGSGIVWDYSNEGIVIIANRHLLSDGVDPKIIFWNGLEVSGRILEISNEYDIGYVLITAENIPPNIENEIYIARHPMNTDELKETILWTVGEPVLQIGYYQQEPLWFDGEVSGKEYMSLFNTDILVTQCYTRAGMSGGGVFDRYGNLIGMISGGEVPYDSEVREATVTYSLPIELLENQSKRKPKDSK